MQPRYYFVTIIFTAVSAVILALLASCSMPPDTTAQIDSSLDNREALVEHNTSQVEAGALVSATSRPTTEPVASQVTPTQDAQALLHLHCARCHAATWLDHIEKPRAEWQKVLERMEVMGVHLSDTDKDVLLEYLSVAGKP
jgi:hypothetical protein